MSVITEEERKSLLGLEGGHVTLGRDISARQLEWRNDSRINAWTRQNGLLTYEQHKKWLSRLENDASIEMFSIRAGKNFVGTCGLTSFRPEHGSAEFSLLIAPEYQRHGYGEKGLIALFKYGFKNKRLNCIWGETFVDNPARCLFAKLGMQEDGILRQRYFKKGEYVDAVGISILFKEAKEQPWWNISDI